MSHYYRFITCKCFANIVPMSFVKSFSIHPSFFLLLLSVASGRSPVLIFVMSLFCLFICFGQICLRQTHFQQVHLMQWARRSSLRGWIAIAFTIWQPERPISSWYKPYWASHFRSLLQVWGHFTFSLAIFMNKIYIWSLFDVSRKHCKKVRSPSLSNA